MKRNRIEHISQSCGVLSLLKKRRMKMKMKKKNFQKILEIN